MENLKIKVNNEAESKEAQELFSGLGYVKENWLWSGLNEYPIELRTREGGYSDFVLNAENAIERQEITLPELRQLAGVKSLNDQYAEIEKVRQSMQKEYLVKTEDGEYHFIPKGQNFGPTGEWIEIPEGADAYIQYKTKEDKLFIKIGNPSQYWGYDRWCNVAKGYETLQDFIDDGDKIFWKRDAGLSGDACVEPISELNQSDINYRAAKAFNEIKQANTLTEDDVYLVLRLVELAKVHGQ